MSDTPRTDDLARGNHVVPTEFAKSLERELNEARDYSRATWQSLRDSQDEVLRLSATRLRRNPFRGWWVD